MRTISLFTTAAFLACVGQQVHLSGGKDTESDRAAKRAEDKAEAIEFRRSLGDEYEDLVKLIDEMLHTTNRAVALFTEFSCHPSDWNVFINDGFPLQQKAVGYVDKYLSGNWEYKTTANTYLSNNPLIGQDSKTSFDDKKDGIRVNVEFDLALFNIVDNLIAVESYDDHEE